jgi:hypothetical protein
MIGTVDRIALITLPPTEKMRSLAALLILNKY